jgi:hypothetical protein
MDLVGKIYQNNLYVFFNNTASILPLLLTKLAFIGIIPLFVVSIAPAEALVTSLTLEKDVYTDEEKIVFVGTESIGKQMVNVALYGPNGKFLKMLGAPPSDLDGKFKTVPRVVGDMFSSTGTYNATGFTDQISEGITIFLKYDGNTVSILPNFVLDLLKIGSKSITEKQTLTFTASVTDSSLKDLTFKLEKSPPTGAKIDNKTGVFSWTPTEAQGPGSYIFDVVVVKGALEDRETITVTVNDVQTTSTPEPEPEPTVKIPDFVDPKKGAQYYLDRYNKEPAYKKWFDTNYPDYTIEEAIELAIPGSFPEDTEKPILPFVDPDEDPQYYIDRYNNEPAYKAWFDENYPDYTIFEAVGVKEPEEPEEIEEPEELIGICGPGTVLVNGYCEAEKSESGGGCLIATATFGSELSPQVQSLRELRDNTLLHTNSGSSFMHGFNQFYYLFSPTIADFERENPLFKEVVKITITPMISSLAILNYANIDSEQEVLVYGIGVILLNIGMYFALPIFAILQVKRNFYHITSRN